LAREGVADEPSLALGPSRPPRARGLAEENRVRDQFFPKGAIASFLGMVVLYLVIWFAVYFIMVGRG
jgi:hypothetical protein